MTGQTSVMTFDQPRYALATQLPFKKLEDCSKVKYMYISKYVSRPIVEMVALKALRGCMKGSTCSWV